MPLVNLRKGRTPEEKAAIGAGIQEALVSILKVPEGHRDQLFTEFDDENFRLSKTYLGLEYTAGC